VPGGSFAEGCPTKVLRKKSQALKFCVVVYIKICLSYLSW